MTKIVILEDEQTISSLLISMLKELRPEWEIITVLEGVEQAVEWFSNNQAPDLIFMDIQLNDGICFSIFDQVDVKSKVIFTTAYDSYAIQAFDVNSIHYLLKPVKSKKLEEAIIKFESSLHTDATNESLAYQNILKAINMDKKRYRSKILIEATTSFYHIFIHDIAYFYIQDNILYAVTSDQKEHIVNYSIGKISEQLDPETFFRANRSTIVNIKFISQFENYFTGKLIVKLVPPFKKTIEISRLKATTFKTWMGK